MLDYFSPFFPFLQDVSHAILQIYQQSHAIDIKLKNDQTPVTQADEIANQMIIDFLHALTPDIPIISEESALATFAERQRWTQLWLVDPLDGTREFIAKSGDFTINIAKIENHQPTIGIIHVPVTGVTYFAYKSQGAFWRDAQGNIFPLHVRPWPKKTPHLLISRRKPQSTLLASLLDFIGDHTCSYRGSALKFGLLAQGFADIYARFGTTYEWDTAAGQCIVEESGGHVIDTQLQPLRYNTRETLLNPPFFALGDHLALIYEWSKIYAQTR